MTKRRKRASFFSSAVAILLTILLTTQQFGMPLMAYAGDSQGQPAVEQTDPTTPGATNTPDVTGTDTQSTEPAETETGNVDENQTPEATETNGGTPESAGGAVSDVEDPVKNVEVALTLDAQSTLAYNDTTYTSDDTKLEAAAGQDLKFTVAAAEGFQIDVVKQIANGTETELQANEAGEYTIAAADVAAGLAIAVETTGVAADSGSANGVNGEDATVNDDAVNGEGVNESESTQGEESLQSVPSRILRTFPTAS